MSFEKSAIDAASSPDQRQEKRGVPEYQPEKDRGKKPIVAPEAFGVNLNGMGKMVEPDGSDASDSVIAAGKEIENIVTSLLKLLRLLSGHEKASPLVETAVDKLEEAGKVIDAEILALPDRGGLAVRPSGVVGPARGRWGRSMGTIEVITPELGDGSLGALLRDYYVSSVGDVRGVLPGGQYPALTAPEEIMEGDVTVLGEGDEIFENVSLWQKQDDSSFEEVGVLHNVSLEFAERVVRSGEWFSLENAEVIDLTARLCEDGDVLEVGGKRFELQSEGLAEIVTNSVSSSL